jgi:hypothetical protein
MQMYTNPTECFCNKATVESRRDEDNNFNICKFKTCVYQTR